MNLQLIYLLPINTNISSLNLAERFIKDCLNGDPKTRMTALEALDHPWFKNSTPTSAAVQILAASPTVAAAPARRKARVREAAPAAKRQKPNRGLCDKKIRNCSYI
jgi:serine/threonine protein kinase